MNKVAKKNFYVCGQFSLSECPSAYWPPTSVRSDTNFGSTRSFFNTRPTPHPLKKTHARVGVSAPLQDS